MKLNKDSEETRELIKEEKTRYKEKIRLLLKNWAVIGSVSVVILSYIQYTNGYGICRAFGLPMNVISIKLTYYIPSVAVLSGAALYIVDCFISLNIQHVNGKRHFSLFRIVWGTMIVFIMLYIILGGDSSNLFGLFLISVIPALVIEFLLGNRIISGIKEAFRKPFGHLLTSDMEGALFYNIYLKPVFVCMVIIILLTPFISERITKSKTSYEICTIGQDHYAVILDNSNEVLVLPAEIEDNTLTIYKDYYKFISKTDADDFIFHKYDTVTITEGKYTDTGD